MSTYSVYIVECNNGSYYTGIATDVARRLQEHESGARGARYLRGRAPLRLAWSEVVGDRSRAQRAEYRIKRLPRQRKIELIGGRIALAELLGDYDSLAVDA